VHGPWERATLSVANIAATTKTGETMTEPAEKGELIYENVDTAPIVYFDIAPAHGVIGGAVQIELAAQIDFDYDLEEIVNMDGVGLVSLKSALKRMPDRIGVLSMLHRNVGKNPSFFNAAQIEALLARYRSDFAEGNPPGHREADEDDF
jgi:hypothetical protein